MWGIRWFARAIALACTATLALVLWLGPVSIGGTRVLTGAVVAGLVIDGLFFLGWFLFPSKKRTRFASGLYARRLMEAVVAESHASDSPPSDWRKPRRRRP